jgi:hypothetical protein
MPPQVASGIKSLTVFPGGCRFGGGPFDKVVKGEKWLLLGVVNRSHGRSGAIGWAV